jgi:hypothetical protein
MTEDELYMPYHNHQQTSEEISEGVWYLGCWRGFGSLFPKHKLWCWKLNNIKPETMRLFRSQAWQEKALDAALASAKLRNKVIFSTTPTYYSQFQSACLLKSRGFELLCNSCYKHPEYSELSDCNPEHPGIPDRYLHWEHIWWKVNGEAPAEIGSPPRRWRCLHNCGVDSLSGIEDLEMHDGRREPERDAYGEFLEDTVDLLHRKRYLAVAWLPRGTPFPKGWRRFFSAKDYKLGVNFDLIAQQGSKVQKCNHNFDLKIFEGWEPNFAKWNPA